MADKSLYGTAVYGTDTYSAPYYPSAHAVMVSIGGVDVSSKMNLDDNPIEISNVLTRQVDTCSLTIYDMTGISIKEWDEIIITLDGSRFFGGYVLTMDKASYSGSGGVFAAANISCGDYSSFLDHVYIKSSHSNQTDKQIIQELFSNYAPDFIINDLVQQVLTFTNIRFNRITLRQVLDQIAEASGGDWYVDQYKQVHYFLDYPGFAPFSISDEPDMVNSFPAEGIVENKDGNGIINRVEVIGGEYLSTDQTIYVVGTGQDKKAILPFKMSAASDASAVQIWRNDGTLGTPIWTPLSVLLGYIDELTTTSQVLYYYSEKVIETLNNPPSLANAFKIYGRYPIPLRSRFTYEASVDFYGKTFDGYIVDKEIVDKETARAKASGLMAKSAFGNIALSLTTRVFGASSGERIIIKNDTFGYADAEYVIQKVVTQIGINGIISANLDLGIYRADFYDIIIQIARRSRQLPDWSTEEVLDELVQYVEGMALTESFSAAAQAGDEWAPSTPSSEELIWSFGRWT